MDGMSTKTTRFFNFTLRFRGYQFYDKLTGLSLPKFQVFATYFRSWYNDDGPELEFLDAERQARFDMICREYISVEDFVNRDGSVTKNASIPRILMINFHPLYGIRETPGWSRGQIVDKDAIFEKSYPGPERPEESKRKEI